MSIAHTERNRIMNSKKRFIYADDVRRELLWLQPELVFVVDRVKTVPAAEITHCKDCTKMRDSNEGTICLEWGGKTHTNGWCYKAERKN